MTNGLDKYKATNLYIRYPTTAYRDEVIRILELQATTKSGRLLHAQIGSHRNWMLIFPFTPTVKSPVNAYASVSDQGVYADTLALGYIDWYDKEIMPGIKIPLPYAVGTGKGSTVAVSFHPATYHEKIKRQGGYIGPGDGPGEVLFHEMTHGMRQQNGLMRMDKIPGYSGFDDEEEFYAILAANVYRTERGFKKLRKDHHGHKPLDERLANSDAYYREFKTLIDRWFTAQSTFCLEMAKIKTWFNPFTSAAVAKGLLPAAP